MSVRKTGVASKRDQFGRSQIADFICPDNGYRGAIKRRGMKPKNHMKENFQSLRQLQHEQRYLREQEEEERQEKERYEKLYKLSQFRNVESRVYDSDKFERYNQGNPLTERSNSSVGSGENNRNYLQKGALQNRIKEHEQNVGRVAREAVERKFAEAREIAEAPVSPRKAPVPKDDGVFQHREIDFISSNRRGIQRMAPERNKKEESPSRHESYGKNPKYLEERKQQMKEEKELKRQNMPDPDCPKGMKLMPTEERLSTLENLQRSKKEVLELLGKMPMVLDTVSSRKKQDVFENKLKEIENAISIFKKPKVFIARDE